jgi:VanZ family protein
MRPVFFYKPLTPSSPPSPPGWQWTFSVWTPVVIAVAIICVESTSLCSSQNTSSFLRPIVERWLGHINDSSWDLFHHYLRKSGHFIGYGLVAFTFLRAWLHTLDLRAPRPLLAWRLQSTLLAIVCTAIVASCDEFHQSFLPDRTGSPLDVLLDTAGACASRGTRPGGRARRRQSHTELIAA